MANLRQVDPTLWRACAGISVHIPAIGSRASYFPQGHAEHSVSTPSFSPLVLSQSLIHCRVLGVDYLADTETDEILAKLRLLPIQPPLDRELMIRNDDTANEFTSVVKILTPSDANNGGGFSVPKSCADLVFPPLDFEADPPVQTLRVKDVLGVVWEFRHIYRGTPRRHLLTTGWSKFVNSKKLVAGDSVVFMVNRRSGENFVFIRRAVKANVASGSRWSYIIEQGGQKNEAGKTAAETVEEAAEMAAKGVAFEIVYYPKPDMADFVVKAEKVERSILGVSWTVGTRVKMSVETEDLSRMTWIQGTVSFVNEGSPQSSPWRMLKVTWDDPDFVKNEKNLSPWQVEYVAPPEHSEFPPGKKCRKSKDAAHGERELFPMTSASNSVTGHLNLMNYSSYPTGMQGARQDEIYVSGVSNFIHEKTHETSSEYLVNNVSPVVEPVSTELNIGVARLSNLSSDTQKNVHIFGDEVVGQRVCNGSPEASINSFQLFGKIIHMK